MTSPLLSPQDSSCHYVLWMDNRKITLLNLSLKIHSSPNLYQRRLPSEINFPVQDRHECCCYDFFKCTWQTMFYLLDGIYTSSLYGNEKNVYSCFLLSENVKFHFWLGQKLRGVRLARLRCQNKNLGLPVSPTKERETKKYVKCTRN